MLPQVYVRDSDRATVGDAPTWRSLTVVKRLIEVGRWTIELADVSVWQLFNEAVNEGGWPRGVIILRDGQVICSGWADEAKNQNENGRPGWYISGWDDNDYLWKCLAWPSPSNSISSQGAHHTVTGPAETRFKTYAQANLVDRLDVPGVVVAEDLGRGSSGKTKSRFKKLLEIAHDLHIQTNLVFTAQQNLSREIVVDVRERRDRRLDIQFSPDVGTTPSYGYTTKAAGYTRVIVAAGGELENRGLRLVADEPSQNRAMRPELFVDARGIDIAEPDWEIEADERGQEALDEHRARATFPITVKEAPGLRYGPDYVLDGIPMKGFLEGDLVRAWLTHDQGPTDPRVDDVVTEVELSWRNGQPFADVTASIGPKDDQEGIDARRERDLRRRISSLERAL